MSRLIKNIACVCGGLFGLAGIAGGALSAHAIQNPHAAEMVRMAALYALVHGAVLFCWAGQGALAMAARFAWVCGVLLFSFMLALRYGFSYRGVDALVPVGGVFLMAGWFLATAHALTRRQ